MTPLDNCAIIIQKLLGWTRFDLILKMKPRWTQHILILHESGSHSNLKCCERIHSCHKYKGFFYTIRVTFAKLRFYCILIWWVCDIQKKRGKTEQISFGQRKCQIVPTFSLYFELNSHQWRFYRADLREGQHFGQFTWISFGKERFLLHLTLRVEQCSVCSSYLGKTRLKWHG